MYHILQERICFEDISEVKLGVIRSHIRCCAFECEPLCRPEWGRLWVSLILLQLQNIHKSSSSPFLNSKCISNKQYSLCDLVYLVHFAFKTTAEYSKHLKTFSLLTWNLSLKWSFWPLLLSPLQRKTDLKQPSLCHIFVRAVRHDFLNFLLCVFFNVVLVCIFNLLSKPSDLALVDFFIFVLLQIRSCLVTRCCENYGPMPRLPKHQTKAILSASKTGEGVGLWRRLSGQIITHTTSLSTTALKKAMPQKQGVVEITVNAEVTKTRAILIALKPGGGWLF